MLTDTPSKTCPVCGKSKPATAHYFMSTFDGERLFKTCRSCRGKGVSDGKARNFIPKPAAMRSTQVVDRSALEPNWRRVLADPDRCNGCGAYTVRPYILCVFCHLRRFPAQC